jgi:hypothetical protein
MNRKSINKIIYFDKETIRNILQEKDHGERLSTTDVTSSIKNEGSASVEVSTKIKFEVPLISRITFLFTGKIDASYIIKRDNTTTISSTEISEFEELKSLLTEMPSIQLSDIENSSTSFRVAVGFSKIIKGGIDGVDPKELMTVMDNCNGYDIYKVNDEEYVRFNSSAFVSNYKRNDLLTTTLTIYCISVGTFNKKRFDFMSEINKMSQLFSTAGHVQTLADIYPLSSETENEEALHSSNEKEVSDINKVTLYDVVYACITTEKTNDC